MATSQPLVPNDRPYGERQKLVAQMQAGGVPTGVVSGPSETSTASAPTQNPARAGAAPTDVSSYDVFANRQPGQPQFAQQETAPVTTGGILADTAMNAVNPFIREFASRLVQLRRG